jgi:hypothetical protein
MNPNPAKQHALPEAGKKPRRCFSKAKPLPPDHWIYREGPRFGFVHALPASLKAALDKKQSEAEPTPEARAGLLQGDLYERHHQTERKNTTIAAPRKLPPGTVQ